MKVNVNVTLADIKAGRQLSGESCPVALAMKRATGRQDITVGTLTVNAGGVRVGQVPPRMRNWILAFDAIKKAVKPARFSITLALPPSHRDA